MSKALVFTFLGGGLVVAGVMMLANRNPDTAAKVKCEFAIEEATALRVSLTDVGRATVSGDEYNGTVRMPFTAGNTSYLGECVFVDGRFHRVTINGELVAGR